MEMSYIAVHRWNETVGMKVLGMSDALMSPISSLRLPRAGFLASAKTNPSPPLSLVFESVERGGFTRGWPRLSLSRSFLSSSF